MPILSPHLFHCNTRIILKIVIKCHTFILGTLFAKEFFMTFFPKLSDIDKRENREKSFKYFIRSKKVLNSKQIKISNVKN